MTDQPNAPAPAARATSWGDRWAQLVFGQDVPTPYEAELAAEVNRAWKIASARREIARGWRVRALKAEALLRQHAPAEGAR